MIKTGCRKYWAQASSLAFTDQASVRSTTLQKNNKGFCKLACDQVDYQSGAKQTVCETVCAQDDHVIIDRHII